MRLSRKDLGPLLVIVGGGLVAGLATTRAVTSPPADFSAIELAGEASTPLFFIDGELVGSQPTIDTDRIDRIEIVKGEAAIALYGERAAGGVVQIFLKQESEAQERESPVAVWPEAPGGQHLAGTPTFTPMTVRPEILNRTEIVRMMEREYPPLLRNAGIGGTVRVFFFIDEEGTVVNRQVDQSSGHPALDEAALRVADAYRFSPALNRDARVPVWVSFGITFQVR